MRWPLTRRFAGLVLSGVIVCSAASSAVTKRWRFQARRRPLNLRGAGPDWIRVQITDAEAEHKNWLSRNPGVTCEHTGGLVKERYLGADTGDRVCMQCFDSLPPQVWRPLHGALQKARLSQRRRARLTRNGHHCLDVGLEQSPPSVQTMT